MPKFLDAHPLKGVDEETLRKAQNSPKDEFGITHDNMLYNKEEDKWYCPQVKKQLKSITRKLVSPPNELQR